MNFLELDRVSVKYGAHSAVEEVSLSIPEGSFTAIVGTNGAGKSSLLRAISGAAPKAGRVTFGGQDISNASAHEAIRRGIAHVPQGRMLFPRLTIVENLRMGGYSVPKAESAAAVDSLVDRIPLLKERQTQICRTLSGGEQQVVAVARGLVSRPKLLLLDEPSLGLAPIMTSRVMDIVRAEHRNGLSVLLVEQNVAIAKRYADRLIVMRNGRVILDAYTADIDDVTEISRAYLGG